MTVVVFVTCALSRAWGAASAVISWVMREVVSRPLESPSREIPMSIRPFVWRFSQTVRVVR